MAGLQRFDAPATLPRGYPAPFCIASGSVAGAVVAPTGFMQWMVTGRLGAGATIAWSDHHGDEALYVVAGRVTVDGRIATSAGSCGAKEALIVESGVPTTLHAETDCELLHFGSTDPSPPSSGPFGPPDPADHGVHVLGQAGLGSPDGYPEVSEVSSAFYADSSCPTCRVTLIRVWGSVARTSFSHGHSEDELIHVTSGSIQVGAHRIGPGMTIAIPADRRYRYSTPGPWEFVNFRRDASFMTRDPKAPRQLETVSGLPPR